MGDWTRIPEGLEFCQAACVNPARFIRTVRYELARMEEGVPIVIPRVSQIARCPKHAPAAVAAYSRGESG